MKYIIVPVEVMNEIPEDQLKSLGLDPVHNVNNTEVILHTEHYDMLFPMPLTEEETTYPFPVYESPSDELSTLLESKEWNNE